MSDSKPRIGILGSGAVGQILAKAFLEEGHAVTLGTRDTQKEILQKLKAEKPALQLADFAATAAFGEILVLAVAGTAAEEAVEAAGKANFDNKVIIDATNPIAKEAPVNGVLKYFTGPNESLMERLQQLVPKAHFVKAFNSVGSHCMYKPAFEGGKPTMFVAGNSDAAKLIVKDILSAFGWETADMGQAASARAIEPLAMLWCIPGFLKNDWTHAFKLLTT